MKFSGLRPLLPFMVIGSTITTFRITILGQDMMDRCLAKPGEALTLGSQDVSPMTLLHKANRNSSFPGPWLQPLQRTTCDKVIVAMSYIIATLGAAATVWGATGIGMHVLSGEMSPCPRITQISAVVGPFLALAGGMLNSCGNARALRYLRKINSSSIG